MHYLSSVLHLLLPARQALHPLLLLFESFLSLRSQILILDDFADLLASFGCAFQIGALPILALFISLWGMRSLVLETNKLVTIGVKMS